MYPKFVTSATKRTIAAKRTFVRFPAFTPRIVPAARKPPPHLRYAFRVRILHVVPTYLPATRYGGPIYAVHGLCRALVARGHQVTVFTTNVDGASESGVPLDVPVELDGVRVRYFRSELRRLYFSRGLKRALQAEVKAFDVVHLHSVFLWPTFAAARAAHAAGVPYVISPRGMLVPELIRERTRWAKMAWLRLFERRTFAQAACIHVTSQREEEDARRVGIPLPHPFIVPNGIDIIPRPAVPRDAQTILYFGRINWKKRIDDLINSLPRIPGARLVIAGTDEEGLTPKLRERARLAGVADRVDFIGAIDPTAKWELLARASVLALPSLSENFGNVVLEAMMMETPVVLTPAVGLAPDVLAANAGIVTDDLAQAINTLLGDAAMREEMGRNGRALVESKFTWPAVAARMEEAYCSIASRR
jgi:glycosyltransferase involved in cell wall biosynthesis